MILSSFVQPLINLPFCPDNVIVGGFSGSFARCPLSAISGYYYGSLICLTQQKVSSQNSSIKSDRYSVCTTTPFTPSDPTWTGSRGLFVSPAWGPVSTSSPPKPSSNRSLPTSPYPQTSLPPPCPL